MSVKRVGRIEYIEPNNLIFRDGHYVGSAGINNGGNRAGNSNDSGAVDTKINSDRFMPYDIEDLCISVDLYVMTSHRNSCGNPENDGDSIIAKFSGRGAASYMYGTDSNLPEQGAVGENSLTNNKHFMTTNFTDISLVNPGGNTNECVGIQSININYSNIFTPIVRITFVDVFGASIFAKEEKGMYDNMKANRGKIPTSAANMSGSNLLASLFSCPYPTFVLVLKGFFGDAVSYHLVCSGTDIKYNDSNGNYEINADFAGSLYGALADIPMSLLSIAPYISECGRNYWANETSENGRFMFTDDGNNKSRMLTFSELLFQNDNLSQNIKKNFSSHEEVKNYQKLVTARKKVGELDFPMARVNPGANMLLDTWYCRKTKSRYYYYYCSVDIDGLTNGAAYNMSHNIRKELETFSISVKDLNNEGVGVNIVEPFLMLDEKVNAYGKSETGTGTVLKALFSVKKDDKDGVFNKLNPEDYKDDLNKLRQTYPVLNHFLESETLENGKTRYINLPDSAREIFIYEIAASVDYREQIVLTKNTINAQIREKKDKIDNLKRDALVELYGYKPTLKNINGVALAHLDTFMTTFYDMLNNIDSKKLSGERSLSKLGIRLSQTDLPEGYSDEAPLPPFTLFYAPTINDNKITEDVKWPTDISNRLSELDEVKYVESIIEASSLYQNEVADFINKNGDSVNGVTRYPGNIYEALENIKNPYSNIISKSNDKFFAEYVSAVFCLRLYYYLATCLSPDITAFAFIEAKNFTNVFDKKFSENVLNYLLEQVNQNGEKYYIEKLCGKNVSSADKEKFWDIGKTNTNHGIFTANGAGELMYTWHKETVDYTRENEEYTVTGVPQNEVYVMPIGIYNFTTIARDFDSKKSYEYNRYITLSNSAFGKYGGDYYDSFNNKDSFRLVSTPNIVLGMFKDKNICVSTTDSGKTKSLESIFFERILQYKDKTEYLPSDIFFSKKDSDAAKKTFEALCDQSSSDQIPNVYTLPKNALKETYSSVKTNDGKKSTNIFLSSVYYNQNSSKRSSGSHTITVSEKDRKRSKAYLYLFSLVNNRFGMLQSPGNYFNKNGFTSFTELLKEGAFYWRMKFMYAHDNTDPINLDNLPYKHAAANEIYSTDKTFMRTLKDTNVTKCSGLILIPSASGAKYTEFSPDNSYAELEFDEYVRSRLRTSISRVENLINLFIKWADGDKVFEESKYTFSDIQNYQELSLNGGWLTIGDFKNLNGKDVSELSSYLRATYKLSKGSKISVKDSSYIDNLEFYAPTDKLDKSEVQMIPEYVKMQNTTLALLLDVYFVYDSSIFGQNKSSFFNEKNFINGFKTFISVLKEFGYDKHDKEVIDHKNKLRAPDVKLSIYLTLKSIYERWCCTKGSEYWKYGMPKEENSSKRYCISQYFVYMDTYYNEIGNKLIVNMDDVCGMVKEFTPTYGSAEEISGNTNGTVLKYMSHIAETCGCTVYALPQDLTMRRSDSLINMFRPIPYNKVDYTDDTSTFALIYKSRYSEHIANDDGFEDDGYDLADSLGNINPLLPESFNENSEFGGDNTKIAAFGVTFGKGNQSYFTKIDFQSSKSAIANSEYAMRALLNVAGSANGATKNAKSYGQDVYSQYANYSYQVTVTMLGCCQVMPLMYFQLNNVPMYHGAYIIQSVQHNVQNGMMLTTFTGIRTSRYGLPLQPGNLMILDSIDWGLEEENFSTEDDTSVWDVTTMNNIIIPDIASKVSYESVEFAKTKVKELKDRAKEMKDAKAPDKNPKPYKKLEEMTTEQKAALNAYFAAYNYNKEFILRNPMQETKDNYEEIHKIPDFLSSNVELLTPYEPPKSDKEKKTGSNMSAFDELLRGVGYETVINVGTSLSGYSSDDRRAAEISVRLSQLRPSYGDILVYYATEIIPERVEEETEKGKKKYSKQDQNRIKGSDFQTVSQGVAMFYYGDKSNSKDVYAYGDKTYSVDNVFIYEDNTQFDPKNPNHTTLSMASKKIDNIHVDCYKWDVKIYRRGMYPIGSSVKKKDDENK